LEEEKAAWEEPVEDFTKYDPEARAGEESEEAFRGGEPPIPDDIDFPRDRERPAESCGYAIKDDDIPW
jgi:hypothetical protein